MWAGGPDAPPADQRRAGRPARGHRRPRARAGACTPASPLPERRAGRGAVDPASRRRSAGWSPSAAASGRDGVGAERRLARPGGASPPCASSPAAPSCPTLRGDEAPRRQGARPRRALGAGAGRRGRARRAGRRPCPARSPPSPPPTPAPSPSTCSAPSSTPSSRDAAGRLELPAPPPSTRTAAAGRRGVHHPARRLVVRGAGRRRRRGVEAARALGQAGHRHRPRPRSSCSSTRPTAATPGSSRSSARAPRAACCPIEVALADSKATKPLADELARLERILPGAAPPRRAAPRPGVPEPGRGLGADDRHRRRRSRRPASTCGCRRCRAASRSPALRLFTEPTGDIGRRRPPAQQRALVGGVRRRRAHRRRHRPARRRGPPARAVARPVGRARPRRPQGGGRRARRAGRRRPSSPAPRSCATPSASRARRSPAASPSRAAAGPPTCSHKAASVADRPGHAARGLRRRAAQLPGRGAGVARASSTPSSSAAASPSTWAWARRRPCSPTSPAPRATARRSSSPRPPSSATGRRRRPGSRPACGSSSTTARPGRRPTSSSARSPAPTSSSPPTAPPCATSRRWPSSTVGPRSSSTRPRRSRTRPTRPPSSCAASRPAAASRSPARRSRTASATCGRSSTSPTPASSAPGRRSSPSSRARARPRCGRSTASSCSAAPRPSPMVAAELPDRIDELDHCTMTPEQIGLYQAVLDGLVADAAERRRRAEAGRDPRRHHRAQADLQPPGRLPGRRPAARRPLGQARPPRGDRRVGVRGRRAGPRLHPLRRVGQAAWPTTSPRSPACPIACYHGGLARGARDRLVAEFQERHGPRRARAVAQGGRHRPQPHRRQPRRALRPLVEPGGRGPGPRPGLAHRPDPHRRVAPPGVPGHRRRAGRGGRGRQAPHRRPRAAQVELAVRPRRRPAARRPRPAPRHAAHREERHSERVARERTTGAEVRR